MLEQLDCLTTKIVLLLKNDFSGLAKIDLVIIYIFWPKPSLYNIVMLLCSQFFDLTFCDALLWTLDILNTFV